MDGLVGVTAKDHPYNNIMNANERRVNAFKWIIPTIDALIVFALYILSRFAHSKAGMNHHAIFKRIWLYKNYIEKYQVVWLVLIVFAFILWIKTFLKFNLNSAISLLLILSLAYLIFLPSARKITIYYYIFLTVVIALPLHLIANYFFKKYS